ncbi:cysteine-rich motor neuron 1 protein-like [Pollicipes pollicipes]|uniref:cysteine-rich motor neuron 1 protein-like n=1 Tax=Pollicipes pollicipes TaxID=41117 RepID=UPI0018851F8C|nr:cysteine-rich motor neuron 1 protein-like [Pollicipes pollicipes]
MSGPCALLLLLVGCAPLATGLSCAPCDPAACPAPNCAGETLRDVCGCCLVCALAEGEPCGYFGAWSRCGGNLVCQSRPQLGQLVSATEGVCTRRETDCQYCQLMLGTCVCSDVPDCQLPDVSADPTSFTSRHECEQAAARPAPAPSLPPTVEVTPCPGVTCAPSVTSCPADSVLKSVQSAPAGCCPPATECVCDLEGCPLPPVCPEGLPTVTVPGSRTPGHCCSQWTCQVNTDPCVNVTCPPAAAACPSDSYLVPAVGGAAACCPLACQCLPDQCRPPACPPGAQLKLLVNGTGRPGACCPVYQCDEEPTCTDGGRTYSAGDTWKAGKCKTCHCKDALIFCNKTECPPLTGCSQITHDPDQCCPRCVEGCRSPSGKYHSSSEQWQEDDCTTCRCVDGAHTCQRPMCKVTCRHPRTVPGRCCPVCDVSDCDVACRHGYRTDGEGNPLCECLSADEVARNPPRGLSD